MTSTIAAPEAEEKPESEEEPRLHPVTLQQALDDPNPLIRYQARQQSRYECGELTVNPTGKMTREHLFDLWQRNRDTARDLRLRLAEAETGKARRPRGKSAPCATEAAIPAT
ncbi:hypothetical protein ACFQ68_13195 [Amycolatopsis japonica]|uniref:hypothetical protein n=1 Tax=Amycolatopsis japonica TaxID=208439 RepID=UPI00366D25A6